VCVCPCVGWEGGGERWETHTVFVCFCVCKCYMYEPLSHLPAYTHTHTQNAEFAHCMHQSASNIVEWRIAHEGDCKCVTRLIRMLHDSLMWIVVLGHEKQEQKYPFPGTRKRKMFRKWPVSFKYHKWSNSQKYQSKIVGHLLRAMHSAHTLRTDCFSLQIAQENLFEDFLSCITCIMRRGAAFIYCGVQISCHVIRTPGWMSACAQHTYLKSFAAEAVDHNVLRHPEDRCPCTSHRLVRLLSSPIAAVYFRYVKALCCSWFGADSWR